MQFVQGLPQGVYAGQTHVQHPESLSSERAELSGFNLALHVQDDPVRVQQHRMILLDEFSQYGVNKMTWMTQTHSTICHTVNEQIRFEALELAGMEPGWYQLPTLATSLKLFRCMRAPA